MLFEQRMTDVYISLKANKKYLIIGSSSTYGNLANDSYISCMVRPGSNVFEYDYKYYGISMCRGIMYNGGGINTCVVIEPLIDLDIYIWIINYLENTVNTYDYICTILGIEI